MLTSWPRLILAISLFFMLNGQAFAADTVASSQQGDIIRITPDASKVLRLEDDAASVIVTNPEHARVILDSPRLLIILPRTPGSTRFTVLNSKGESILEKSIVVAAAAAKQQYVRIRRMCGQTGSGTDCVPVSYYFCPDGCFEVSPVQPGDNSVPVQGSPIGGINPSEFSAPPSGNSLPEPQ